MSQTRQKVARRRGLRLFQPLLVIGLLALVWFSFGKNVLAPPAEPVLPHRLGTLELVRSVEGAEAIAQVSKLHGLTINLVSASIAEYASRGERVTVWVGSAESRSAAVDLTERMVSSIGKGAQGFSNPRRMAVAGNDVWQVDGMSAGSFYFYHSRERENSVVWLTVESPSALPLLEIAVRSF